MFGGLTYDQRRCRQERFWCDTYVGVKPGRESVIARFKDFVRAAEGSVQRKIEYVVALEYQKNGWPHLHPLLDIQGVTPGDIARVGRLWFRMSGGNKLSEPRNSRQCAAYAAKYLSKDIDKGDVLFSKGLSLNLRDAGKQSFGVLE